MTSISEKLKHHQNVNLSVTPTPIYNLERISTQLGVNIFIKREDMTGFGLGGNKVRKLDYLIGDAISVGADTLVTMGASSFSRNAAFATKIFGLELHVLVAGEEESHNSLSRELFSRCGSRLYYCANDELQSRHDDLVQDLTNAGKKVYVLHPGGSNQIGSLGYVNVFDEIVSYTNKTGIHFDYMIHAVGSCGTMAGLCLGRCLSSYSTELIGMVITQDKDTKLKRIRELIGLTANMLGCSYEFSQLKIDDQYIGPGYPLPSAAGEKAVECFARMEGIMLDQPYTGKAAAGLIDYARQKRFHPDENVLFIHTGGNAGVFY